MQIHLTTVWRHLKKSMGHLVTYKVPATHPVINNATGKKRLAWAQKKRKEGWNWGRTVFIDEAMFKLGGLARPRKVWMVRGREPYRPRLHQGGVGLKTIIAFSMSPSLPTKMVFCTDWRGEGYRNFLRDHITKGRRDPVIIMHDNAPSHRARIVRSFQRERLVIDAHQPPNSPDTQPVENVIAWLKNRVYGKNRVFTSLDELQAVLEEAFAEFRSNQTMRKNLALSLPGRIQRIIEVKGGWP